MKLKQIIAGGIVALALTLSPAVAYAAEDFDYIDSEAIDADISLGQVSTTTKIQAINRSEVPVSYAFYIDPASIADLDLDSSAWTRTKLIVETPHFEFHGTVFDLFTKAFIGYPPLAPGEKIPVDVTIIPADDDGTHEALSFHETFGSMFMFTEFHDPDSPLLKLCAEVGAPIPMGDGCSVPAPPVVTDPPTPTPEDPELIPVPDPEEPTPTQPPNNNILPPWLETTGGEMPWTIAVIGGVLLLLGSLLLLKRKRRVED